MSKRITILGAGESGTGAAMLAVKHGYEVFVSDAGIIKPEYKSVLQDLGVAYEERVHTLSRILEADTIIKSPGMAMSEYPLKAIREYGVKIIDELEFAFHYTEGKIVAITGTNGKTTTTLLTYHLLKEAGMDVGLAGNVGQSMARQLVKGDHHYWVLEMSSFQLENIEAFRPDIAIMLNITPDHLNRYEYKMELYAAAKFRMLRNTTRDDLLIYNLEDPLISLRASGVENTLSVARKNQDADVYATQQYIRVEHVEIDRQALMLKGKHNLFNAMCAVATAVRLGVDKSRIEAALKTFRAPAHRLEYITSIGTVHFYNDSKATNLDSVYYALESFDEPVVWIAGGVDKGNDYEQIRALVEQKVKALVCLGRDNEKLKDAFGGSIKNISESDEIRKAARMAYEYCDNHDVVLLSPGCASFDLFLNYEDRGEKFRQAVLELKAEIEKKYKN